MEENEGIYKHNKITDQNKQIKSLAKFPLTLLYGKRKFSYKTINSYYRRSECMQRKLSLLKILNRLFWKQYMAGAYDSGGLLMRDCSEARRRTARWGWRSHTWRWLGATLPLRFTADCRRRKINIFILSYTEVGTFPLNSVLLFLAWNKKLSKNLPPNILNVKLWGWKLQKSLKHVFAYMHVIM